MMGYDKSIICIFKTSFLNYVTDLEEWYLSLANMPQHKSRGHKIRRKEVRKQGFSEPRICLGEGEGFCRGGGNLPATSQTTVLSAHQTERHYITLSQ